jgi:uncharacterized integral membrane protein (TIGR00698 family)
MSISKLSKVIFVLCGALTLHPQVPAGVALLLGIAFALTLGNPYAAVTAKWTTPLLQVSVVGLGAAMNLETVFRVGLNGFYYTLIGISLTLLFGLLLGKLLKIEREISILLTAGTAICGGSAIAAVASTIQAKNQNTSIALAAVFLLNALALLLFPPIGHFFGLDEIQFGLWSSLAIHDTSSVVGAALQYGAQALEIATPVKLARALWIVPVAFAIGISWNKSGANPKAKKPWFILGFLIAAAVVTYIPELKPTGYLVAEFAKRLLVLTLFLIGSGLTKTTVRNVGFRPLIQAVILWFAVSALTLSAIRLNWIGQVDVVQTFINC